MASPDNILLRLTNEHDEQVRDLFSRLADAGFPTQHQTPHITVTFSPNMQPEVVTRAAELLPSLIPAEFRRVGHVVFGTKRKQTVAWLLETSDALEHAAREISALNPAGRGPRWIPHLTVGLRLRRDMVPDYLRALDELTPSHFNTFIADEAVFWRPRTQSLTVLSEVISPGLRAERIPGT